MKEAADQEWVEQWFSDATNGWNYQQNTISAFPLKNEGTVSLKYKIPCKCVTRITQ